MNNIYVETMPETLAKSVNEDDVNTTEVRMWFKSDVAIKFLSDRLAEERKRVVQEIRKYIKDKVYINELNETFIDEDIYKILDQIERGE